MQFLLSQCNAKGDRAGSNFNRINSLLKRISKYFTMQHAESLQEVMAEEPLAFPEE
jgi:hypothetical protein